MYKLRFSVPKSELLVDDTISYIPIRYFADWNNLQSIFFFGSDTTICESAFSSCRNLESVRLPKNLKIIKGYTFFGCSSLKTVLLPELLETIETYSFAHCKNLSSLELPKSITKIEANAFAGCDNLILHFETEKIAGSIILNKDCHLDDDIKISYTENGKSKEMTVKEFKESIQKQS